MPRVSLPSEEVSLQSGLTPVFFPHVTGSTEQRGFSGKKSEVKLNVPLRSEYGIKSFSLTFTLPFLVV